MVPANASPEATSTWLLCRAGEQACGLPIEAVRLTLRRSRLDSWGATGASREGNVTDGVATIRGETVPVVSLGRLLSGEDATGEDRLVLLGLGDRRVALGVSSVLGVRSLPSSTLRELPPLLGDERSAFVDRLGRLDGELLLILRAGKLLTYGPAESTKSGEGQA